MKTRAVSLRLPEPLYQAARKAAALSNESLNTLIVESVTQKLRSLEEHALYDAFTVLGEDIAGADVEFALEAQGEVVERAG